MISWAVTLKELREQIDSMIAVVGEDAPVGTTHLGGDGCEYMDEGGVQIEYVYITMDTGFVVGDEAEDYEPAIGEIKAVKLS